MAMVYRYRPIGILTVGVLFFTAVKALVISSNAFTGSLDGQALSCLRASAAKTPTATIPEDVSLSRGRNVEGKES